jgi:hypothetical protein
MAGQESGLLINNVLMKHENPILTGNHKRSFSSTLIVIEQLLIEIKDNMVNPPHSCCAEVHNDVDISVIENNLLVIEEALDKICSLKEKYKTDKFTGSLQRVIDAKRAKIWETLQNSKSKRMKGFGEFPPKAIKEYDADIDNLMTIADKIKIK